MSLPDSVEHYIHSLLIYGNGFDAKGMNFAVGGRKVTAYLAIISPIRTYIVC